MQNRTPCACTRGAISTSGGACEGARRLLSLCLRRCCRRRRIPGGASQAESLSPMRRRLFAAACGEAGLRRL